MKIDAGSAPTEGQADFPKLVLKTNETARVCILSTKSWEVVVRHWVAGVGYVFCHAMEKAETILDLLKIEEEGGQPENCILCNMMAKGNERVSSPQRRFAVRVLRYKTDVNGRVSSGALRYWLEIWIIDNNKYRALQRVMDEWGGKKRVINNHDLTLNCSDGKYQKIDIDVKKEALWLPEKEEVMAYFAGEAKKHDLADCLGVSRDEDALKRRFAVLERRTVRETPVDLEKEESLLEETTKGSEAEDFDFEKETASENVPSAATEKEVESVDFIDEILNEKE